MTYALERRAIEAYIAANWTSTPVGFDAHEFTPSANSIHVTINSGAVMQGSVGRVENQKLHFGTVVVQIITEGGKGSAAWRGYAETLFNLFREKRLTSAGVVATTTADVFLRFSPPQSAPNEHPYISASFPAPPFHLTNVTAPFVRYSYS